MLLASALAGGCVSVLPPGSRAPGPTAEALGLPVGRFGVERCGAGSLSAVLNYLGDPVSLEELDSSLPKAPNGGVLSLDLLLAARARGFDAQLVAGDGALLEEWLERRLPVILMLRVLDAPGRKRDLYHYVVVDGADDEGALLRVHFGDGRARWTSLERLRRAWEPAGRATLLIAPGDGSNRAARPLAYAVALEETGRTDDAAALYQRLLAEGAPSPLLWTNLGNAEAKRGRRREAETAYRSALELDPDAADALNNLAWLLLAEGVRLEEAERLARSAVAAGGPDLHLRLDTLGTVLLAAERCAESGEAFERALAEAPEDLAERATLHLGLARALHRCGDPALARDHYERAVAHGPPGVRAQAEAALEGLQVKNSSQ